MPVSRNTLGAACIASFAVIGFTGIDFTGIDRGPMHIARIVQTRHRLSLETALQTAWDAEPRQHLDIDLVWVETDDGRAGVGAGPALPPTPVFEDLFLGRDPMDLQRHNRVIESLSFYHGPCWALDVALWDLAGKINGVPVWQLLGGAGGQIAAAAAFGDTRPGAELGELARDARAEGFRAVMIRLYDENWRSDVARVKAIRDVVGRDIQILADWGQGAPMPWLADQRRAREDALNLTEALEDYEVYWIDNPLHRGDYKGMQGLRQRKTVKIAAGSTARDLHDLRNLIVRDAVDVIRADATLVGGLTGLFPVLKKARERGAMVSPSSWYHGIAMVANAHLAAAVGGCPYFEYPVDPPSLLPEQRDFLMKEPLLTDREGFLDLGERAGLGLILDNDVLVDTQIARP